MKKIILSILLCGVMILGTTACSKDKEYTLNIYKLDDVSSVIIDTLSQYDNRKEFTDEYSINEIYSVFSNKTTYTESINDNPANPDVLYVVEFNTANGASKSVYIYKKGKKYYIEQPYNGIYQITQEEYNSIETFVK